MLQSSRWPAQTPGRQGHGATRAGAASRCRYHGPVVKARKCLMSVSVSACASSRPTPAFESKSRRVKILLPRTLFSFNKPSRSEPAVKNSQWGRAFLRIGTIVTVVCFSILGISHAGDAPAAIRVRIDIPPEDLGTALRAVAQTRELYVIFAAQDVESLRTTGATGTLTADETFKQLLQGSGLTYRFIDDKTVTILPERVAGADPAAGADKTKEAQGSGSSGADFEWLKRIREVLRGLIP